MLSQFLIEKLEEKIKEPIKEPSEEPLPMETEEEDPKEEPIKEIKEVKGHYLFPWEPALIVGCSLLVTENPFAVVSFLFFINLFYFWLCWVFIAVRGLSLVAASGGYSLLQCVGFSLQWLLLLQSTGPRRVGFSSCGMWDQ